MNFVELIEKISTDYDADLFFYSGAIEESYADLLIDRVHQELNSTTKRKNVCLFLCTNGGDPDAAYKIAKCLKRHYEKFSLYVFGYCKSAGTLIALGANEIIMSLHGELGPLDVQLAKRDEILFQGSGLDLLQAMDYLNRRSTEIFDTQFMSLIVKSGGAITIKTAADIAGKITSGLLSPIVAQVDPVRLGEMTRAVKIAYDYGKRLNADEEIVHKLINDYPSHSFVIDFEEAQDIFKNVRELTEIEEQFKAELVIKLRTQFGDDYSRIPASEEILVLNLGQVINKPSKGQENKNEKEGKIDSNNGTNGNQENGTEPTAIESGSDNSAGVAAQGDAPSPKK